MILEKPLDWGQTAGKLILFKFATLADNDFGVYMFIYFWPYQDFFEMHVSSCIEHSHDIP